MSWFTEHRRPFPNVEYGILHVLERERGGKPKDLAYAVGLPQNKCGAWLSIIKRRDLIRRDGRERYHIVYVLTSLGEQRLAFLMGNSSSSEKQTKKSERATSVDQHSANDLPAKGYPKSPSKRPMISRARAAGGRREQGVQQ